MVKRTKNKRKGPDTVVRAINWIAGLSWLMIFIIFIMVSMAKPRMETMYDRFSNSPVSGAWDSDLVSFALILLLFQLGMCIFGLFLNSMRMKRKTDKYNGTLIFFTAVSFIGIIVYFISF